MKTLKFWWLISLFAFFSLFTADCLLPHCLPITDDMFFNCIGVMSGAVATLSILRAYHEFD